MIPDANIFDWRVILEALPDGRPISAGYSGAERHLVTIQGRSVFVKQTRDTILTKRIRKEIAVYNFLRAQNYAHIPAVLAVAPDLNGFALDGLTADTGWQWKGSWSTERLRATLRAMDELAALGGQAANLTWLQATTADRIDDAWELTAGSDQHQRLVSRFHKQTSIAIQNIDFQWLGRQAAAYRFKTDTLTHNDVRDDNCAWQAAQRTVCLIDWDWLQFGDRHIDVNALLVNVVSTGFKLPDDALNRLHGRALAWLANYWFKSAATPIWPGGNDALRDGQLNSALTAYELARQLSS